MMKTLHLLLYSYVFIKSFTVRWSCIWKQIKTMWLRPSVPTHVTQAGHNSKQLTAQRRPLPMKGRDRWLPSLPSSVPMSQFCSVFLELLTTPRSTGGGYLWWWPFFAFLSWPLFSIPVFPGIVFWTTLVAHKSLPQRVHLGVSQAIKSPSPPQEWTPVSSLPQWKEGLHRGILVRKVLS